MKPIELTLKGVIKNAKAYAKAGKLQFQKKDPGTSCEYGSGKGVRCVIGASFTPAQISKLKKDGKNEGTSVSDLVAEGIVSVPDYKTKNKLQKLQEFHDKLAFDTETPLEKRTAQFMNKLELLSKKA